MTPLHRIAPAYWLVAIVLAFVGGLVADDVKLDGIHLPNGIIRPEVTDEPLWFVVVRESEDDAPSVSRVLKNTPFWQSLEAEGHHWRHYDDDQPEVAAGKYLESLKASGVSEPGLLVLKQSGEKVKAVPLPKTTDEIAALKKEITGR